MTSNTLGIQDLRQRLLALPGRSREFIMTKEGPKCRYGGQGDFSRCFENRLEDAVLREALLLWIIAPRETLVPELRDRANRMIGHPVLWD